MKISAILSIFILAGCGGKLSDDQRRKMHEEMELHKIVHVTEVEITEAAFAKGRETIETLESLKSDSAKLDSFVKINNRKIRYLQPGDSNVRDIEQQLMDAYLADKSGAFQDNVQEKRDVAGDYDSLLYTKPVSKKLPDGSEQLQGIWNIWMAKKELILEIGKTK